MLTEKEIIQIFASKLGIANLDDVALLGRGIVFKVDMLVASTDVPHGMAPWQVARKSVVSCVSDLAAKGVQPHAAMISLGLPKNCTRPYVEGLANGFAGASKEFGVRMVGGDTNETSGLVIDCSMIGFASKMPTRTGAKPGDVVVISGTFGLTPAGLEILMRNAKGAGALRKYAVESVLEPKPRQRFGIALAKFFSSSIDSSDGLAISLYELAGQSGVNIVIDIVPAADGVEKFAQENGLDAHELVFHGGEEYEIVATIPKSRLNRAISAAKKAGIALHIIGRVQRGPGDVFVGKKLLENKGYVHFDMR
ncbi:MAG: thiamine-phosphate kinase [Thaumarchaeota archaeon 13_1_40CM_3_50_5]|nr:MAG: thiamine-phosphate kinase [Thaumarchaeota archaeon 13_1_40CM_3_50_5]